MIVVIISSMIIDNNISNDDHLYVVMIDLSTHITIAVKY